MCFFVNVFLDKSTFTKESAVLIDKRYVILRLLGGGGCGRVHEAIDLDTGSLCAIKIAHDEDMSLEKSKKTLEREFKMISSIPEHPNCIKVLGGGDGYYVMEKFGYPIFLYGSHIFKFRFVCKVMLSVFRALSHYHAHGCLHLDIKPDNILMSVSSKGRLLGTKLIDPLVLPDDLESNMFMATPEYASPEVMSAVGVETVKSDLYSAGLVFYELLMGEGPFPDGAVDELYISRMVGSYPPVSSEWSRGIRSLVYHLLEPYPEDRPKDALSCIERLKSCMGGNNQQG